MDRYKLVKIGEDDGYVKIGLLHDDEGDFVKFEDAQAEISRLNAALEPIREVWQLMKRYATRYDMPYNSMESAIERCMEILGKGEADE